MSLESNTPIPHAIHSPADGKIIAMPYVGGLQHGYRRAA
jgi:hypothetical protein